MSRLPNAPLIEVIYEFKWQSDNQNAINKFELLLGNMFEKLKSEFPIAESLKPDPSIPSIVFVNQVTHRFRSTKSYPLYQLGPGILSVNTIDKIYDWEDFSKTIKRVFNTFLEIYKFNQDEKISFSLKYIDFYKIDPSEENLYHYLSKNFNLDIDSSVIPINKPSPKSINFGTTFETDWGLMNLQINTGTINMNNRVSKNGLVIDSTLIYEDRSDKIEEFDNWIDNAHSYLSDFFKKFTSEEMYQSFTIDQTMQNYD